MILQIIILGILLFLLPFLVGGLFVEVDREGLNIPFRLVSGQFCLWFGFQLICVPLTIIQKDNGFIEVIRMYWIYIAAMLFIAIGAEIKKKSRAGTVLQKKKDGRSKDGITTMLGVLVIAVLAIQLILVVFLAYEEGDDAFYVATSNITVSSNTMYQILPYLGNSTGLDVRHALAPFPIWVAFLARMSGMHAATVAQIVLPVVLIPMSYTIYYLIGRRLYENSIRRLPLFLLFIEVLVMTGGQSVYTAENFLIVRTAQGKAVLAAIVIPFMFYLFLSLLQTLEQKKKIPFHFWSLMGIVTISACLCSTQGALLVSVLTAIGGICTVFVYKKWKLLLPFGCCSVVPMIYALLYLFLA